MPDDIVTRLREKYQGQLPICAEAADEIERLRAKVERLQERLWVWRKLADDMANCLDSSTEASNLLANYERAVRSES